MKVVIDNQEIETTPGNTILETAEQAGIHIPNLCMYQKPCGGNGLCRLCIVEVKTSNGTHLVESCTYPVMEEMMIRTSSPLIEDIRRNMISLLVGRGDFPPGKVAEFINVAQKEPVPDFALIPSDPLNEENLAIRDILHTGLETNPHLAYIVVNKQGYIRAINQTYLDIMGIEVSDALGRYILDVVPNSELLEILQTGRTDRAEFWTIKGHDTIVNRVPIIKNGEIIGATGYSLFLDMSSARIFMNKMQERKKEFNNFLQGLLENPYLAYVIVDKEGYITAINQACLEILEIEKKDALGRYVTEILPNSELPQILKTGRIDRVEFFPVKGHDTIVSRMPITQEGEIIGAIGYSLFLDMSGVKILTRKLKETEKQLKQYKEEICEIYHAKWTINDLIGTNPSFTWIRNMAESLSFTTSTVLITGESGTGKELVAQAIHNSSHRRYGPFIRINCVALPESLMESELFGYEEGAFTGAKKGGKPGKFELASGGTIFLDEIGDMPLSMQIKLLVVLQEKIIERVGGTKPILVDVRVIAATNRNLEKMIAQNEFREDLFYRLNVVSLEVPPLRERMEDLPLLVENLMRRINLKLGTNVHSISPPTMELLQSHDWPGNVRELENLLERAINLAFMNQEICLGLAHFPSLIKCPSAAKDPKEFRHRGLSETLQEIEKEMITQALQKTGGNKNRSAKLLKIHISALYRKLDKYGLNP